MASCYLMSLHYLIEHHTNGLKRVLSQVYFVTHTQIPHRFLGPIPRISDSIDLDWNQRIYISNKFPSDALAAGLETTLKETSPLKTSFSHAKREVQKKIF